MKFFWVYSFLLTCFFQVSFAQSIGPQKLSTVKSIDDFELPPSSSEASEAGLPQEEYYYLSKLLQTEDLTILSESQVQDLFNELERDPRARNKVAGGKCAIRRKYIQGYLKKRDISSGRLYIQCPSNNGHMKLIDQVTGRRYTFSNFHDVNIVAVPNGHHVMDVQFKAEPLSLSEYLAQVEASQKLKPLRNRDSGDRGYCYWSIR